MDRIANFFNELAQLKVDIIVSSEAALVRAAKKASTAVPIVMVINGDPVRTVILTVSHVRAATSRD